MDAARLIARLIRDVDFACRRPTGDLVLAFAGADLREAHVIARRIASVLKHTMLSSTESPPIPAVTLATWKRGESADMLLARLQPAPVAAA